jgi:hypothetical protein
MDGIELDAEQYSFLLHKIASCGKVHEVVLAIGTCKDIYVVPDVKRRTVYSFNFDDGTVIKGVVNAIDMKNNVTIRRKD